MKSTKSYQTEIQRISSFIFLGVSVYIWASSGPFLEVLGFLIMSNTCEILANQAEVKREKEKSSEK